MNALPPKKTPDRAAAVETGGGQRRWGGGGGAAATTDLAPALTKLKLSHASFRKGKSTTISFRLSEAAKVTLSFERKLDGRRVRGKCVKPAKGAAAELHALYAAGQRHDLAGQGGRQQPHLPRAAIALEGARGGPLPADAAWRRMPPASGRPPRGSASS